MIKERLWIQENQTGSLLTHSKEKMRLCSRTLSTGMKKGMDLKDMNIRKSE